MKTQFHIQELYKKYIEGQCSDEELTLLLNYFDLPKHEELLRELVKAEMNKEVADDEHFLMVNSIVGRVDLKLKQKLAFELTKMKGQSVKQQNKASKLRTYWNISRIAAAAVLCISLFAGLYFYSTYQSENSSYHAAKKIAPGGNKAILTLADGRQIALTDADNGELAEQSGLSITKAADGSLVYYVKNTSDKLPESGKLMYNSITTPRGGQYTINLPDGSRVWLNAASTLKFPTSLGATAERRVELNGEAYFEVRPDKSRPFKVITRSAVALNRQQEIEVLGTHFNVSAYDDESSTKTTLLEGSVKVNSILHAKNALVLSPGQQSVLDDGSISLKAVNPEQFIAWKNNKFMFDGNNVQGIMRQISRWYDVDVIYKGSVSKEIFSGKISRFKNLAEVLDLIELTGLVHFKVEGRRIIVMP